MPSRLFSLSLTLVCPHDTTGLKEHFAYLERVTGVYMGRCFCYLQDERCKPVPGGFPWDDGWTVYGRSLGLGLTLAACPVEVYYGITACRGR